MQHALVPHVHFVHRAVACGERGDQPERGLAVVRAAALHEEVGPLVDGRVAVEVKEVSLDLPHDRGARLALQLLVQDRVVRVEVAEVVGRHCTELLQQPPR